MTMKTLPLLTSLALFPTAAALAGVLPEPFAATRYDKMLEESPFALATPTAAPAEPAKSWAVNYYLGPVWRIVRDGEEREYAVVKSRGDISGSFTLTGHDEGPEGVQLVKLEWQDDITKTKAVVKKGTEFATLEPDQSAAPSAPPPQPRPNGQPGMPPQNGGGVRRPGQPVPPPQPIIPRPANTAPPVLNRPVQPVGNPVPAVNPNGANQNDRQRIRVINSK